MTDVHSQVVSAALATGDDAGVVTLANGVVLEFNGVSHETYMDILSRFPAPAVPMADTGKGRLEENPNDPAYDAAVKQYKIDLAKAITDAAYVLGVKIKHIPDNVPGPDDADWLEEREYLKLSTGDSKLAKRLDWLRHKAVTNRQDYFAIMRGVGRQVGTPEADVDDATKSNGAVS